MSYILASSNSGIEVAFQVTIKAGVQWAPNAFGSLLNCIVAVATTTGQQCAQHKPAPG